MSHHLRAARPAAVLAVISLTAVAFAPAAGAHTPAVAVGPPIQGVVSWTTTDTTAPPSSTGEQAGVSSSTSTATTTASVTIKLQRDPRYPGAFRVQDVGSTYSGSFSLQGETQENSGDGISCTTTVDGQGTGEGALTPTPASPVAPSLFASVVPAKKPAKLGASTQAIVLRPFLEYTGDKSITRSGGGEGGCAGSSSSTQIQGSLAPGRQPAWVCYPPGTDKALIPAIPGAVIGVWNDKTKRFGFNCTLNLKPSSTRTVTIEIRGSLKYG